MSANAAKRRVKEMIRLTVVPVVVVALLCVTALVPYAYASGGDGSGGGSGGGGRIDDPKVPLLLESSSVTNGARDVALDVTIQLTFSKIVSSVETNHLIKNCFHLSLEDGTPVPIRVIIPDDQMQNYFLDMVFIQPQEDLPPDSTLRLAIDSTMHSVAGTPIYNAYRIEFSTGAAYATRQNEILEQLGVWGISTFEQALPETIDSIPADKEPYVPATPVPEGSNSIYVLRGVIIAFAALLLSGGVIVLLIGVFKRNRTTGEDESPDLHG
jgi:hypothetical protein